MKYVSAASLFAWPRSDLRAPESGVMEVIGVPSDFGNAYVSGTRLGPAAIRRASLGVASPQASGIDHGDVQVFDGADWADVIQRVRDAVKDVVQRGGCPLVLGGDHAVSYAAVSTLAEYGPLDIVWFDAHTDFCPWAATDWHNHKQVLRRIASLPNVERLLVVGHRGITYFDESSQSPKLDVVGIPSCGQITSLPPSWLCGERPVYLSIDIDVLDPCAAPGTGHPVPGGLETGALCDLVRQVAARRNIVGADLMEVNPTLDIEAKTSDAAARVLAVLVDAIASHASHAAEGAKA